MIQLPNVCTGSPHRHRIVDFCLLMWTVIISIALWYKRVRGGGSWQENTRSMSTILVHIKVETVLFSLKVRFYLYIHTYIHTDTYIHTYM